MKKKSVLFTLSLLGIITFVNAGIIKVVSTTTDSRSIAEFIGGNKISATSIASGYQNPHFVDPKPSYIISLSNAWRPDGLRSY
jgi:ABC-type Zn uptake system ZnuABC Zn-binding protein ZnuA